MSEVALQRNAGSVHAVDVQMSELKELAENPDVRRLRKAKAL
jgi:predicted rRNA methylase YqxC with S4 and FtsJ domains